MADPASSRTPWLEIFGSWSVAFVVMTTLQLGSRPGELEVWQFYLASAPGWYFWAPVTAWTMWAARPAISTRRRWLLHSAGAPVTAVVFSALLVSIRRIELAAWQSETFGGSLLENLNTGAVGSLLLYVFLVAVAAALENARRVQSAQLRASRLETELASARLDALQSQVRPHFLFNSLNAIAGLVRGGESARAVELIARLSDLLRHALEQGDDPIVPLHRELDFADRYLDVEQARFGERLNVDVQVDGALRDALVPRLLLQPLVENAVKHGVCAAPGVGHIAIRADADDGQLHLRVTNSGPPVAATAFEAAGIGLTNTRARLATMFQSNAALRATPLPDGGATIHVALPLTYGGER